MDKYIILVILNLPLIIIGILSAISGYKTKKISKRKAMVQVAAWLTIGVLLMLIEPIYNTLVRYNLTNSTPMSLFDMALLPMVLFCLLLIKRANEKITHLNRKVSRLHENLAIAQVQKDE